MEKKKCYLAPEAELRTTKIRCSILAGSDPNNARPTGPTGGGGASGSNVPKDPDDARVRIGGSSLGF